MFFNIYNDNEIWITILIFLLYLKESTKTIYLDGIKFLKIISEKYITYFRLNDNIYIKNSKLNLVSGIVKKIKTTRKKKHT